MTAPTITEVMRAYRRERQAERAAAAGQEAARERQAAQEAAERQQAEQATARDRAQRRRMERDRVRRVPAWRVHPMLDKQAEDLASVSFGGRDIFKHVPPGTTDEQLQAVWRIDMREPHFRMKAPEPAASTAEAIVRRLEARGIQLEVTPDANLLVTSKGGRISPDVAAVVRDFANLLAAHIRGSSLACSWCKEPATSYYFGGARACPKHAD